MSEAAAQELNALPGGVLATPPLVRKKPKPQAHQGTVESVTTAESERTGTRWIEIALNSTNTGASYVLKVFPPKGFVENPNINPSDLPSGLGVKSDGTPSKMSEQDQYAAHIANQEYEDAKDEELRAKGGNATIQNLLYIAAREGREAPTTPYTTFEEYVDTLHQFLSGIDVVFTLGMEKKKDDSDFGPKLEVKSVLGAFEVNDKRPKPYNESKGIGFIRIWENE